MPAVPLSRPIVSEQMRTALLRCVESRWLGYGARCRELEATFTEKLSGWALATSACTSALYLAGRILAPKEGDEVVVPAMTFASTAVAMRLAGFRVRCADVDPSSLLLTAATARAAITTRTRAIVVVHLYGQRAPIEDLATLCATRGLALVEDCAHRLPTLEDPPLGDIACCSFNAVKELASSEGGMLWGRNRQDENIARAISNVGLDLDTLARTDQLSHHDTHFTLHAGLKLRSNDLAASLVLAQLPELEEGRRHRRRIARAYDMLLDAHAAVLSPLSRREDDAMLMYTARCTPSLRASLRKHLADRGVATSFHYPVLSKHPLVEPSNTPSAEKAEASLMTIPCFADMRQDELSHVLSTLEDACAMLSRTSLRGSESQREER
jgi:dTDP-4-amino-4,6-dideoxygalactose transaminase